VPAFAWVALAPLLRALVDVARARSSGALLRAWWLGFLAGSVYFVGTVHWLVDVMRVFGGLHLVPSVLFMLLLAAYMAIYPGVFAMAMVALLRGFGPAALWLTPFVWIATEFARGTWFGGFPWVNLGYSQATVIPIAQVASLIGVYGLSGVVALVSAALVYAAHPGARRRLTRPAIAIGMVLVATAWGARRVADGRLVRAGEPLPIGLVQGNVQQDQKWDPAHRTEIVARHIRLTREAAARGARFIVWPESSTPFHFEEDRRAAEAVRRLARETGTPLLVGSDQIERGRTPRYYNAAFLVGPDGRTLATYRKIHLVPFGEYVPLKRLLFFVGPIVEAVADFSPGDEVTMLPVGNRSVSTAICYEVVYPSLIRQAVLAGSELLTTITNDAWYGYSSAPHQHFQQATLRAVEQGRYLVRAANTGISGIVDPYGRVVARTPLFETTVLTGEVRLLEDRTVYGRIGDLAAYASMALTAAALLAIWRGRRKMEAPWRS
jgi:apolipoprotein N-acyltransferase